MKSFLLALLVTGLVWPWTAQAGGILEDLDAKQVATLNAGKLVAIPTEVPGGPWPRLQVYSIINAPVRDVEAVFRDYPGASSYIPNLVAADILEQPDKNTYHVRYTSSMPMVGKSSSTVRNIYSREDEVLLVRWNLIESELAEVSTGEFRVEPYRGGSLLRYTNFVKPKSLLAVLVKFAALGEAKQTVTAIKKEAERRGGK